MTAYAALGKLSRVIDELPWPVDFFDVDDLPAFLDKIVVLDYSLSNTGTGYTGFFWLAFPGELALNIPGLTGVSLVAGKSKDDLTFLTIHVDVGQTRTIRIVDTELALRYEGSLLTPVPTDEDPNPEFVELVLRGTIVLDGSMNVTFQDFDSVDLAPAFVGKTGIIISAQGVRVDLSRTETAQVILDAGFDDSFLGVFIGTATVQFPEGFPTFVPNDLVLRNCAIGSGGISGRLEAHYDPPPAFNNANNVFTGPGAGELFGVPFGISLAVIDFKRGTLQESSIKGQMQLPFFENLVDVELGLHLDGSFGVSLTSADSQGLLTLTKPGLLSLELDSLAFTIDHGTLTTMVSGTITPLVGGLSWPSFRVNELAIDSKGNVRLDGGWLDLPNQYSLDFHGFQMEITKLGFGKTEDGKGKWIGFSGGIKLVDGIQAGASVDGLRITWYDTGSPKISFDGVGVEFEIPDTLRFKGYVGYKQLPDGSNRFDGSLTLDLLALDMEIDGKLVFGSVPGSPSYTYGALYLSTDLPTGIPLLSTGVALYGMAGLVAMRMEPNKQPNEDWYRIGGNDWYHRTPLGVENLAQKWTPRAGSFALGAGVTLGTAADNGHAFAGRFLFVVVLPGPILLLQGAANLLKDRAKLSDEPQFRALAVLDGRAGTFLIGLDAQYRSKPDTGSLIDIRGSAEAFFSFHDPTLWHIYLGQRTPQELRIRASLAKNLFQANAYFMLDGRQLATGAWIGYTKSWNFSPVSLSLEAWIEGNALVSWRPTHVTGNLCMHGSMAIKVFKFGVGLTIDSCLSADVSEPFDLKGTLTVGIDLPKPLKDITVDVSLEWGPEAVNLPTNPSVENPNVPLPAPLKEIAIEHFKVTTSWPPALSADPVTALPVVPLDCRPHLSFARPIHDVAQIGMNGQAVVPEFELIGDPTRSDSPIVVRYALEEIALNKLVGTQWVLVARKGQTANPNDEPVLFGSWAAVPSLPDGNGGHVGQTKLWLWSKTPYDYTRHTGGAWDDGLANRYTDYPHCGSVPDQILCCTFEDVLPEYLVAPPLPRFAVAGLKIGWQAPPFSRTVPSLQGLTSSLCFPANVPDPQGGGTPNQVTVQLPPSTSRVTLLIADEPETCIDFTNRPTTNALLNPYIESGASFLSYTGVVPAPTNAIVLATTTTGLVSGLNCRSKLEITLPYSSSFVDLAITCATPPATVDALGPTGSLVARITVNAAQHETTVHFSHGPIAKIVITSASTSGTVVHHVCFDGSVSQAEAMAHDTEGNSHGPFTINDHVLDVRVTDKTLLDLVLTAPTSTCLLQVCVTVPAPEQQATQHLIDEHAQWEQTAPILDPHTVYQLVINTTRHSKGQNSALATGEDLRPFTNYAYFKTDGPPALADLTIPSSTPDSLEGEVVKRNPDGTPKDGILDSVLDTLAPYVAQTIPATVPAAGEKPPLPRPVYRAYDVGVQFNEDYVDLMYRLEGRDLGLYLYDRNNRPVRDANGRLLVLTNRWGRSETPVLDAGERRWINAVGNSDCLPGIDTGLIPSDVNLTSAAGGLVLDADTVYEARLVPLLVHEDFTEPPVGTSANTQGAVPGWSVQDDSGLSAWVVGEGGVPASRFIAQTSSVGGGSLVSNDPLKPGTMLKRIADPDRPPADPSQPANWSDYRLTVTLHTNATGAIGVVFRMKDAQRYYRFSFDHSLRYRRLVRVGNAASQGVHTILAEDAVTLDLAHDTVVTVEAVGPSLRVYHDGALVFDVVDDVFATGGIALYAWKNPGARFSNVRIDDFSATSVIAYRFTFTTSRFATFVQQQHSFQDEVWLASFATDPGVASAAADAQLLTAPVTEAETRAYEILATAVLGPGAHQDPEQVEVTRVEVGDELRALLVRSPEPVDWTRATLTVQRADGADAAPARVPGALKLTGATFASLQPAEESVTLVARTDMNTSGSRVEVLLAPGPLEDPAGAQVYLRDDFDGPDSGLLFQEGFGPNALDHYAITDSGTGSAQSAWSSSSSEITQAKNPGASGDSFAAPESTNWTDVRVTTLVQSDGDSAFGVAVRFRDPNNQYTCVLDTGTNLRTIRKTIGGVNATLFQDSFPLTIGHTYKLTVDASGDHLVFYLDDALVAAVQDAELASGQVALYSAIATGAHFSELSVEALEAPSLLYQSVFEDAAEIETLFGHVTTNEAFLWTLSGGQLTQTSTIADPTAPDQAATFAVLVSDVWIDTEISVQLRSDAAGSLGVAFRWTDVDNAYRFSLDGSTGQAMLLKVVAGVITTLWSGPVVFALGQTSEVTLRSEGTRLAGFLDGTQLFTVTDPAFASGQVALFCGGNPGASFSRVVIADRVRRVGGWTVADEGSEDGPSIWQLRQGLLQQTSTISGGADPAAPGTVVVRGDETWSDYRITARMSTAEAHALGVVFRYQDRDNYYRLSIDPGANVQTLVKKSGGVYTTLWPVPTQPGSGPVGTPFTLTIDALGSRIVGYQDGVRLFDIVDTDHATGVVGMYCAANDGATFESMDVRRPPQEAYALLADHFPADTAGWVFLSGGTQAVAGEPTWTDLMFVARVQLQAADSVGLIVRYADSANYYNFVIGTAPASRQLKKTQAGVTTVLWSDAAALVVGRAYELAVLTEGATLRCYLDGVPVCVIEDASPIAAGKIGLSAATGQIPTRFAGVAAYGADRGFSDWLLDQPFDELTPGRWTIEDAGDTNGPSVWSITGGAYAQSSGITGGVQGDAARPGTFAVTGDASWSDYRVSVRLASSAPGDIGVLVRYVDPDNYYLFSLSLDANLVDGRRRLIAVTAGTPIVLAEDQVAFTPGREALVTVDCVGTLLRAFVDGMQLFAATHSALPFGGIGLYAAANPGAMFAEVRVAPYDWLSYYEFEGEDRFPAGTRIRLVAGNDASAPPAAPGVISRALAFDGERGRVRFPADGVDLRVIASQNVTEHTRRILPPAAFAPANLRLLRSADGTGLALMAVAGAPVADGEHRFQLTYRRDNRSVAPESTVFTQNGDATEELATLDIPLPPN